MYKVGDTVGLRGKPQNIGTIIGWGGPRGEWWTVKWENSVMPAMTYDPDQLMRREATAQLHALPSKREQMIERECSKLNRRV